MDIFLCHFSCTRYVHRLVSSISLGLNGVSEKYQGLRGNVQKCLSQKFLCGERFMLSSFMHKLEVKRNCLRWRCGSIILFWQYCFFEAFRVNSKFTTEVSSQLTMLSFLSIRTYGDQRFDSKSCGRASVTPGRNSGKVAAKSKEEKNSLWNDTSR